MNQSIVFFRASFRKSLMLLKRYTFNSVMQVVALYLLFGVVFFGGNQLAPDRTSEALGPIIVGYFLWIMAIDAYSATSNDITREAQWGTLEQLYMSPLGTGRVFGIKSVVNICTSVLMGVIVLMLMLLTTGKGLEVDLLTVVPLAILAIVPVIGVGFVTGGLALLYKRVSSFTNLLQFAFIALVAAPLDQYPFLAVFPLSLGNSLLQRSMTQGIPLWELSPELLALQVVLSVVYLLGGYAVFRWFQDKARERGVLGHY